MTDQTTPSGQTSTLEQTVKRTGVLRCLECGKCTAICPVSRYDHHFSPRRTVGRALMRHDGALLSDDRLWTCLTCMHCSQVCPAGVDYPDLTLAVRAEARRLGAAAVCTHGEAIHAWMRLMMDPALKQDRLGWLVQESNVAKEQESRPSRLTQVGQGGTGERNTKHETRSTQYELHVSEKSDTLYFVGCAPYYGALFKPLGVDGDGIARSTVRVLNALGIEPQVLADERCCGHDLLWEGDIDGFRALAELNAALIRESGAKRIVTACPECARALKIDYPAHGIDLGIEVLHLAELLARHDWPIAHHAPRTTHHASRITYHDPCRLGRHLGVYDAPRQVIEKLGLEMVEMPRNRANALCCGTNGWTHCTVASKAIQVDRLREARATGADLLVTACIKCQIHFRCAMEDYHLGDEIGIEIKDLATLVAERLEGEK
jgi:heterodisulfide reductase subunit D